VPPVPAPIQLRGIAPEIQFIVYHGAGYPFGHKAEEATNTYGMDLSSHAYMQSDDGFYTSYVSTLDHYLRHGWPGFTDPVPPRPMVWAAGNNGVLSQYSQVKGYFSVEAPAKNVITVGAGTSSPVTGGGPSDPRMVGLWYNGNWSTSLGPTWDGRIKPEVIAPASDVKTTKTNWTCYGPVGAGTSLASGVVSGTLALMQEQYASTYGIDLDQSPPLPSTLKAVLIQTATDLVNTTASGAINPDTQAQVLYHAGPDYATGFGLVNAQAAVELITQQRIIESSITSPEEVDEYSVLVHPTNDRIQFSLAWDDEPYEGPYADQTISRLVNDLDLTLIAPDGTEYFPWKLDPLTPAADPADPDPITAADITPAHQGPGHDHLNNVEQVTVNGLIQPGKWRLRVAHSGSSPGLLETPQPYSLVGDFTVVPGIDGVLRPGEWDAADMFGPTTVNLPGGGTTTATVFVMNDQIDLLIAVRFDEDLSSFETHTIAVRMDENPVDDAWNGGGDTFGDDGFVVQHKAFGSRVDRMLDEHFNSAVVPPQGQRDDEWGGTNHGITAITNDGSTTIIEMSHPLNSGDYRDADLVQGQDFGLLVFTVIRQTIGSSIDTESTDLIPAWATRKVR